MMVACRVQNSPHFLRDSWKNILIFFMDIISIEQGRNLSKFVVYSGGIFDNESRMETTVLLQMLQLSAFLKKNISLRWSADPGVPKNGSKCSFHGSIMEGADEYFESRLIIGIHPPGPSMYGIFTWVDSSEGNRPNGCTRWAPGSSYK